MRSALAIVALGAVLSLAVPLHKRQDFNFGGGEFFDSSAFGSSDLSLPTNSALDTSSDTIAFNEPAAVFDTSDIAPIAAENTEAPAEIPPEVPAEAPPQTPPVVVAELPPQTAPEAPTEAPPQTPAEVPAEAPAQTPAETVAIDNTVIPPSTDTQNTAPPPPENVTPPSTENVTPPPTENVTPPPTENVTPPPPQNETPPVEDNQTPAPGENTASTAPTTPGDKIALAPNGITSETLNPPTDSSTTSDDDKLLDAIDDLSSEDPTPPPADTTTTTTNTSPADANDSSTKDHTPSANTKDDKSKDMVASGDTSKEDKSPPKDNGSNLLTDEDLASLDEFLDNDSIPPTPGTTTEDSKNAASNTFPDAKASGSPDDLFSTDQVHKIENYVSDFAFTPGKTFDINDIAGFLPNTQPTPLPGSNTNSGGGSSGANGGNGGNRVTSGNRVNSGNRITLGYRQAQPNAGNNLLQQGVSLALNQLLKLLNPNSAQRAPAQRVQAGRPLQVLSRPPGLIPVTRGIVTTKLPIAPVVVTTKTAAPSSPSATVSISKSAAVSGSAATVSVIPLASALTSISASVSGVVFSSGPISVSASASVPSSPTPSASGI